MIDLNKVIVKAKNMKTHPHVLRAIARWVGKKKVTDDSAEYQNLFYAANIGFLLGRLAERRKK